MCTYSCGGQRSAAGIFANGSLSYVLKSELPLNLEITSWRAKGASEIYLPSLQRWLQTRRAEACWLSMRAPGFELRFSHLHHECFTDSAISPLPESSTLNGGVCACTVRKTILKVSPSLRACACAQLTHTAEPDESESKSHPHPQRCETLCLTTLQRGIKHCNQAGDRLFIMGDLHGSSEIRSLHR